MAQELCEQAAKELEKSKSDRQAIAGEAAKRAWKEAQEEMEEVLLRCRRLRLHCYELCIQYTAHHMTVGMLHHYTQ
jgi:hypothetical protein